MILYALIALDIISGAVLLAKFSYLMLWMGAISFLKGCWSLFTSIKAGYFFDWMGVIDVFGGVCMLLLVRGIYFNFFVFAGIALIIKGIYSFFVSLH